MNAGSIRNRLRHVVEDTETYAGRLFDIAIQALILASMVALAIGTLPDFSPRWADALHTFERLTLAAFVAEYALRLGVAHKPLRYATSFFGVVDLLAIAPAIFGATLDARALRSLRLLRLLRLLKLARYNRAVRRLHVAIKLAWEELMLFLAVAAILLFIAAAGVYEFENEAQPEAFASIFHALWWAVATLTTVGYGDVYPVTAGGRLFTFAVLLVGLGVVAAPTAMVASALTQARRLEESGGGEETIRRSVPDSPMP